MTLYCGIDLHSTNSVVSVLDERDQVLFEKRLPNTIDEIVAALVPYRDDLKGCVVESTYNWYWLVDGLRDHDFPAVLAHPGASSGRSPWSKRRPSHTVDHNTTISS